MAYPVPSIYSYRVVELPQVASATGKRNPRSFQAQFSTDSEVSWRALTGLDYQSLMEAYWAIKAVVSDETQFQASFLAGTSFVPDAVVVHDYPPA